MAIASRKKGIYVYLDGSKRPKRNTKRGADKGTGNVLRRRGHKCPLVFLNLVKIPKQVNLFGHVEARPPDDLVAEEEYGPDPNHCVSIKLKLVGKTF